MAGPAVVLVTGTDQFKVVDRFGAERDRLVQDLELDLGADDFDGGDPDTVTRALDAARTPSMFGDERLVVLRHGINEDSIPLLDAYVADPSEGTTLLLLHVRTGRATKAYKDLETAIAAVGEVHEEAAPPQRTGELAGYIAAVAADHGVTLAPDAAGYLAEHLGPDAGAIEGVAAQLGAVHPDGHRLGRDAVAEFVAGPAHVKTWDLTDAIDAGDTTSALRALQGLLLDMHPMQVHAAVVNHVRRLLAASELDPASAKEVESELGIKGYPAKKVFEKVRRLPPQAFVAAHRAVARADIAMRGGSGLDPQVVLEALVVRLAVFLGGRGSARRR